MIVIVDYGVGNLFSLKSSFAKIGVETIVSGDKREIEKADKLILPGVGAFEDAAKKLRENRLGDLVIKKAKQGTPLLGICLGMQLLFEKSFEFGEHEGLSLLPGEVVKFDEAKFDKPLKIPHVGWNTLSFKQNSPLRLGLKELEYLYFVHSYHVVCDDKFALAKTTYGYEFTSAVQHENLFGFQPHPEKSHEVGLKILENFARL